MTLSSCASLPPSLDEIWFTTGTTMLALPGMPSRGRLANLH
ncbi:MAG TPA: hypothetical protein VK453_12020 [Micromonosporaceae bacterium]|nr:hypothetical protein [Micromonosporaceae bacterium]